MVVEQGHADQPGDAPQRDDRHLLLGTPAVLVANVGAVDDREGRAEMLPVVADRAEGERGALVPPNTRRISSRRFVASCADLSTRARSSSGIRTSTPTQNPIRNTSGPRDRGWRRGTLTGTTR